MNVYNLKKIEKCYVYGNVDKNIDRFINTITSRLSKFEKREHPKEIERQKRLSERNNESLLGGIRAMQREMNNRRVGIFDRPSSDNGSKKSKWCGYNPMSYDNSLIVVSGNGGIGMKSKKYYEDTFGNLEKILADNNCYLFFIRGNNDDPSYFSERLIDFEHVKTIPDYSVLALKTYNCLCVGGSVSIDKEWKLFQEEQFGKKSYWENEAPIFDEKQLDEILSQFKISCVITSTSPSFVYPSTNAFKNSKWFSGNKSIKNNFTNERKVLDKIYEKILDSESKPYIWVYGRFKIGHNAKVNDMVFLSLEQFNSICANEIISSFFGVDTSKVLKPNEYAFDEVIREEKKCNRSLYHDEPIEEVERDELDELEEIMDDGGTEETVEAGEPYRLDVELPPLEWNVETRGNTINYAEMANYIAQDLQMTENLARTTVRGRG